MPEKGTLKYEFFHRARLVIKKLIFEEGLSFLEFIVMLNADKNKLLKRKVHILKTYTTKNPRHLLNI